MKIIMLCLMSAVMTEAAEINLKLDPDLVIQREVVHDKSVPPLVGTLPLCVDHGKGCVMEMDFTVSYIWFYAPVWIGLRSADGQTFIRLRFDKTDAGGAVCTISTRRGGKEQVVVKWRGIDCDVKYRLIFKWGKDGKVEFLARNNQTTGCKTSFDLAAPLKLDEFYIRVPNEKGTGYIGYDCEEESIYMQSGGASYNVKAFIDYISMKSLLKGNEQ